MEITMEVPNDREIRRELAFDPRFYDADALVDSVPQDVLDYRLLASASHAIQTRVHASAALERYTLDLWNAVRDPVSVGIDIEGVDMVRLVQGGASPRGMAYLVRAARVAAWLDGRAIVVPEDLRFVFDEVMAHRVFLDPIYELRHDKLLKSLFRAVFATVPVP
jgi:MoxR-like ATPase